MIFTRCRFILDTGHLLLLFWNPKPWVHMIRAAEHSDYIIDNSGGKLCMLNDPEPLTVNLPSLKHLTLRIRVSVETVTNPVENLSVSPGSFPTTESPSSRNSGCRHHGFVLSPDQQSCYEESQSQCSQYPPPRCLPTNGVTGAMAGHERGDVDAGESTHAGRMTTEAASTAHSRSRGDDRWRPGWWV